MRGGNRQVALIAIEAIAVLFLLALWVRAWMYFGQASGDAAESIARKILVGALVLSPVWLSLIYLIPLPSGYWAHLPGRAVYQQLMSDASFPARASMPLSLVPDATMASLLAGIPVVAAFLAGYVSRLPQLRLLLTVVAGMAFLQVLLGLFQAAGGPQSTLYFTTEFAARPFGTFANTNHYANYLAMALTGYIWLGTSSLSRHGDHGMQGSGARFGEGHAQIFWIAGGLLLLLGVLMTWSRGAALSGLPAVLLAGSVALMARGHTQSLRRSMLLLAGILAIAVAFVGVGALMSRFDLTRLAVDASFRSLLASSTLTGAHEFWPWGAGWGTYASVYPRFQPLAVDGYADYAHQDYAQMLFEGGIFSVLIAIAFLWLAIGRAARLLRSGSTNRVLEPDELASAVCGLGLLGFLLHSLVEFNMHIPANAILASLLAGVFLRPLHTPSAVSR